MALKQKKGLRSSIDDVLDDLLLDDESSIRSGPTDRVAGRSGALTSRSGKRSLLDDDFFNKLAEQAGEEEASDVSEADPAALLENMKDMDDMDTDLFGSKRKPSSAPLPSVTTDSGTGRVKKEPVQSGEGMATGVRDSPAAGVNKPSSAPAASTRTYRKFSFTDEEDFLVPSPETEDVDSPLADVLNGKTGTKTAPKDDVPASAPPSGTREGTVSLSRGGRKREELTFDEDEDDLMDALGFGESPKGKASILTSRRDSEPPQPARTRLDEILGRGTSAHLLERPPTGEKKDVRPVKTSKEPGPFREDDFIFGSYQPTVSSTPEGRQSRKQSVRFSTEGGDSHSPERKSRSAGSMSPSATRPSKPAADWTGPQKGSQPPEEKPKPTSPTFSRPSKPASDWLGLKQHKQEEEDEEEEEKEDVLDGPQLAGPSHGSERPGSDRKPSVSGPPSTAAQNEDWLVGALSQKKNLTSTKPAPPQDTEGLGDEVDLDTFVSKQSSPPAPRRKVERSPVPSKESSSPLPWETTHTQAGSRHSSPVVDEQLKPVPTQAKVEKNLPVSQTQGSLPPGSHQQLLLQQQAMQSRVRAAGGAIQSRGTEQQSGELTLQARIIQLEGQVRTLQLERDQTQMLLESIQQRHQQDVELMESTYKARVTFLEESATQREVRARQENEDLVERLAGMARLADQERAELQAQYHRRLAQSQQDRDGAVERLRELQRRSIQEMKKDHEEQLQRLKHLKEEEIDAVTSATSQTRSLAGVIEQMEQFSRRLAELSSRVEITHEHTTQGLEQGAKHREQQLRVLQEQLEQQQGAMAEERARLKEVIARMETQLGEQQRQLEKERWRVSAEQVKAESAQRALEEERKTLMQHISLEREELERAKSALLEEQKAVMQRCTEERRRLTAERNQFHTQEKLWQERAEREASRALERDANRDDSIIGMAQEQADLKLRAGELRLQEEAMAKEKVELEREKERLSAAAVRLKTRAQEVEEFSKLASDRYEEGERALQEAQKVEAEHQARLRSIHAQVEQLRQQEQHLHQERIRIAEQRRELHRLSQGLPISPRFSAGPSFTGVFPPLTMLPTATAQALAPGPQLMSSELQAKLALLRQTAEKDRDFLQDEQFFLETLKTAPYNSAFSSVR